MSQLRQATEQDFRLPEYHGAKPEDYEVRKDGKAVRKDRWENGIRSILNLTDMDISKDFEVRDVIKAVEKMAERLERIPLPEEQWFMIRNRHSRQYYRADETFADDIIEAHIFKDLYAAKEALDYVKGNRDLHPQDKDGLTIYTYKAVIQFDTDIYVAVQS